MGNNFISWLLHNSLNIQEFVENQERIDELVRKTEKNDSRNKIIFQSSYPSYNYNISNTLPVLHHSSSVYKTQSPFYFSNNNSIYQVNKNIKYSLPITKYSVQPVKYKKPKMNKLFLASYISQVEPNI